MDVFSYGMDKENGGCVNIFYLFIYGMERRVVARKGKGKGREGKEREKEKNQKRKCVTSRGRG